MPGIRQSSGPLLACILKTLPKAGCDVLGSPTPEYSRSMTCRKNFSGSQLAQSGFDFFQRKMNIERKRYRCLGYSSIQLREVIHQALKFASRVLQRAFLGPKLQPLARLFGSESWRHGTRTPHSEPDQFSACACPFAACVVV